MDNHQPHNRRCANCGAVLQSDNNTQRFCSQQCLDDYGAMFNRSSQTGKSSFSLTNEITKLQEIIRHEISRSPADLADSRNTIAFYEDVVERTRKILKWINASALINQDAKARELKETQKELKRAKIKMDILLQKAADLKRENKTLKSKQNALPDADTTAMARNILGVREDADITDLKKAFRQKAKLVHPDRKHGDADLFKSLRTAYLLLEKAIKQ